MASINDYGSATDPLSTPSLADWAAAVAAHLNLDRWTAWTPTVAGGSVSAVSCHWRRTSGGLITVDAQLTIATVTGPFSFTLPYTALQKAVSVAYLTDTGTGTYGGLASIAASACTIWAPTATAGGIVRNLAAGVPHTWAAGDFINVFASYRAAALP